jgi:hypothetical protein
LVNHVGKLYLSEEACEEKWKLRERSNGGGSSSRGGGGRGANRGRVVATEMARTTTTPAVQLSLDRARWGAISAASVSRKGTRPVIAGPS